MTITYEPFVKMNISSPVTINITDIKYFFNKNSKDNNDSANKIREYIICSCK